jgi:hypothetical protein
MTHRKLSSHPKDAGTRAADEVFAVTAALGVVPAISVRRSSRAAVKKGMSTS